METTFVEIVTKVSVTEEISVELECGTLTIRRRRTITRTKVVATDMGVGVLIGEEFYELLTRFDTIDFKLTDDGVVGENESGSLKVEMRYRELHAVGVVLA